MNETINTLLSRRSVRKFKSDPVPENLIDEIIKAGLAAPSALNRQTSVVIAVTNKKMRDVIAAVNASVMGKTEEFDPFYGAPVILMVIARNEPNAVYDGTATMVNMLNAAAALSLGSCWIHRAKEELELPFGKDFLKELGIEGDYIGIGHVALGFPDGELPAPHEIKKGRVYRVK